MNNLKSVHAIVRVVLVLVCFQMLALGQTDEKKLATVTGGPSLRFDVSVANSGLTVTVAAPDGQVFRRDYKADSSIDFKLADSKGSGLPDGQYTYELRVTSPISSEVKTALSEARAKGDDDVPRDFVKRGLIPAQPLTQSGGFSMVNGSAVVGGALKEETSRRVASVLGQPRIFQSTGGVAMSGLRRHHPAVTPFFDFVIADDLIVQGSACVGLDCVNGEVFNFDTLRVKENNTRIQFDDTSASAGFATNNWQIRANSSASGGGSFLAFVDQGAAGNSETGTIVFEVDAGAPANALRVSSTGNVGIGTATPVLDVHANTTDTPAIRLEQNNSGGFTAQTWDIAGNEANFFIRDVTGGSRLS